MQKKNRTNKHCNFKERERRRQKKILQSPSFQIEKNMLDKRRTIIHYAFYLIPGLIFLKKSYSVTKNLKTLINPDISGTYLIYYLSLTTFIVLIILMIYILVIIVKNIISILKTNKIK